MKWVEGISLIEESYEPNDSYDIGAPGVLTYTFYANEKSNNCEITFSLARSWEDYSI